MNGYELSRAWFDFAFENPEKIKPNHGILYFFIIEHCNRLGWKRKFGLPSTMAKDAIGIRSYNTYINTLNDLVEWGFIEMIEKSKNQYSSNIIALSNFDKAHDKALDKALIKHTTKQRESIDSIDKQLNNKQINNKLEEDIVFPNRFKEKQTDPEYSKHQTDLAISICSYLNVPHPESGAGSTEGFRYIRQFVVNIENAGKIDYFKDQFNFYKKAWDSTSLKPHNYKKYIGTFPDYSDGVWCSKDWKKEVKGKEKTPEHTTMEDYHKMFGS